jgi:hypothetical protein
VIHLNETTVMRLADGKDAALPPVRHNESLAGGRDSDELIDSDTWRSFRHGRNRFASKGGPKEFESMVNRDGSRSYNDKNLLLGGGMRACRLGPHQR